MLLVNDWMKQIRSLMNFVSTNNNEYQNICLTCDENDACGLDIFNEKQHQIQLREAINLEHCSHH